MNKDVNINFQNYFTDFEHYNLLKENYNTTNMGYSFKKITNKLEKDEIESLLKYYNCREFELFFAIVQVVVSKLSNQQDLVFILNNTEDNSFFYRNQIDWELDFFSFIKSVEEKIVFFEKNIEEFNLFCESEYKSKNEKSLFDISFDYRISDSVKKQCKKSLCELDFTIIKNYNSYSMEISYCENYYTDLKIFQIVDYILYFIKLIENNNKLAHYELITSVEKTLILNDFNATETEYPKDKTVVELFEEQVRKTPDNTALVFEEESLTYAELNARANNLAYKLRENGVKPDDFVAIIADRSIEMICGIYGIIKAGGAYVPIDPTYPEERIRFMLEDCQPKAVLKYTAESIELNNGIPVIDLADGKVWEGASENPEHVNTANDLIYCIYTSGTTGKPKGVTIEHHGVAAMQDYLEKLYEVTENDNVLQFANYIFDASVWEMTLALYCGATLVLVSHDTITDTASFEKYVSDNNVTLTLLPPQYFRQTNVESFRVMTTGGSASDRDVVNHVKEKCRYINAYGPTENTVLATHWEYEHGTEVPANIPIGKPISNTKIYITNGENLCGIGVPGELCIAGDGLARGYLNRPELTVEKFVKNPFGEGRMYRSGDLARWLPDGNIEYLGRIDEQVKIRGFRIELGEIESRIREIEGIRDCAVTARADSTGDKAIYAYYTSDTEVSVSEIRDRLSESLPEYMIPAYMTQIESIPVTRNGKIDYRELSQIEILRCKEYVAPETENEKLICDVLRSIFDFELISVNESFVGLGGDSIKGIKLMSKLRDIGIKIKLADIIKCNSIRDLAILIKDDENEIYQGECFGDIISTPAINEFLSLDLKYPNRYNHEVIIDINEEPDDICDVLNELYEFHDCMRAVFRDEKLTILPISESEAIDLQVINIEKNQNVDEFINNKVIEINSSLCLEDGPLFKAVLFYAGIKSKLYLTAHHLIVDYYSWHIIIDDLLLGISQIKSGKRIEFPNKTISYVQWANLLNEYKINNIFVNEKKYWDDILNDESGKLFFVKSGNECLNKHRKFSFTEEFTRKLLYNANDNTQIIELLLAALGRAIFLISEQKRITIGLEINRREQIESNLKNDRTVGRFSNIFPFIIRNYSDTIEQILETKVAFESIPGNGIGYGILYNGEKSNFDVYFNFLGSIPSIIDGVEYSTLEYMSYDQDNQLPGSITINGEIYEGELRFSIFWNSYNVPDGFIDNIINNYKNELEIIVEHFLRLDNNVVNTIEVNTNSIKYNIDSLPKVEDLIYYPMTSVQKRMYAIQQLDTEAVTYNISHYVKFRGEVRPDDLRAAIQEITDRHEILRTQFLMIDGEPVQKILDRVEADFEYVTSEESDEMLMTEFLKPFDIGSGKTIRAKLVNKGEYHLLMLDMHHIVGDGMSMNIFTRELMALYNGERLEPLTRQFKDYSEWMRSRDFSGQEEYWKSQFEDEIPVLDMPTDYPRPQEQSYAGAKIDYQLDDDLSIKIKKLIKNTGATEYMIFLASAMVTLSKYSRQEDIVIGSPINGRTHSDTESMLGMFVNTLAMRGKPEKSKSFSEFLEEIKNTCLKAYENQEYPFDELVEAVAVQRDMSRNPLFDVMLAMQNNDRTNLKFGNGEYEWAEIESTAAKFDMTFNIHECNGRYVIGFEYCTDLFKKETAERILEHYIEILKAVTENAEKKLGDIEMVTSEEKSLILNDFNATETEYPRDKTVVELFEEQVRKTPDNTALVFGKESLTYAELNARANSLAYKLRENGVKPDDFVAIIADRSIEMICGIYGIIKAGGAYVPIDPAYPEERIRFMLKDCQPKAVLKYTAESIKLNNEIAVIDLADGKVWEGAFENPEHVNTANDLIYCIYTSGTTGKPKGVAIEHHGVAAMQDYLEKLYEVTEDDRVLQFANYIFDASVWEMTMAMYCGAALVLIPSEKITDTLEFEKYNIENKVTLTLLPPQYFRQTNVESFRIMTTGGSASDTDVVRHVREECRYVNAYGPTENTVLATHWEYEHGTEVPANIPIGKPISNTKVYIANGENLCGIGVPGELCIAGDGLARGYLNRPELTAEKFVKNPFGEGRMYRSGDLARWLPDGNIEYLGRIDEQVKIRGFRIELGEIESRIREIEVIRDCAVTARADSTGDKAIYAYYTSDTEVSVSEIRDRLSESLPEYMIPAYMTQIESIPVTRNGKLDKRALPEIETKNTREYAAPRNEIEEAVCHAFSEILNVEQVGIKDSFFELGGDSIKAIRIISKLRNAGYTATVKDVMNGKTAEKIAFVVKNANEKQKYEQGEVTGKIESTPIIREFAEWNLAKPEHFNQAMMFSVDGIDNETIHKAIEELVKHHDILRAVYRNNELEIMPTAESRLCDFYEFDYRNEADKPSAVAEKCTEIQGSVDLENGPLVKIAVFELGETKQMMFCIHHLAVDGVSWRILSEDFETAAGQLKEGKEVVLPEKTASFAEWSKKLKEYGEQLGSKEKDYWKKANAKIAEGKIAGEYTETETGYTVVEFSKETTEKLLTKSSNAYGAKIDEVLIAGLARAVGRVTGQKSVAIKLEGHGREEIHEPISIDRTVGWFTNVYAVSVECSEDNDEAIINAKDTIRSVPNMGMGYGYVEHETMPDICFNYLGDFSGSKTSYMGEYSCGRDISEENSLPDRITINGQVMNGVLKFIIMSLNGQNLADRLKKEFEKSVDELAGYCAEEKHEEKTVSDYGISDLSSEEFAEMQKSFTGEVEKIYDLTPLQAGMLFHNLEDRGSTGYVVQSVYKTEFEVEAEKLREAIKLLSRRYEVLRTGFVYEKVSEPKQIVYAEREPELEILEASDEESKQISEADINRGFDLSRDTMLRLKSINIGKGKSKIVLTVHHIIMDGWCMGTLVGKLFEYYFRLEKGEAAEKIEKEIGEERRKAGEYSEYIEWLGKQDTEKAERYWKEELEGYESDCEIKAIRKPEPTEEQMREMFGEASIAVTKKLKEEAERTGSTINTAAEAAVGIMLQSCSGSKDVVFGKVVSGRNADIPGIEKMVGLFVNTIPVRVTAEDDITVTELLKKQQEKDIESTNYDYCSIAEIQSKTAQGSDLIKVLYVFENYMSGVSEEAADEESSIRVESAREQTNYGISISGFENEGKLGFKIMYDPNKYCDEEIHLIMERLLKICEEMANKPDAKICELETVTEAEKQLILNDFNATETEYPRDKTVVELFEEQVRKTPDNTALVFGDKKLTYAELNARANSLAYKLRKNGVKPDDFVAIIADRSIEMICGIYGIIKAGGAYVPIDPTYPEERIRFMLEDCQPKAVLKYTAESIKLNNETAVIDLADGKVWEGASENPEHVNTTNDLIYCIYTSGTTGKPKGVTIEHHGVAAMQDYLEKLYEVTENDNVLQFANYIFDASVWEMTLALYCGATLVLVSHDTITDTASFEKYVSDNNVTLTLLPPQYFRQTNVESFRVMTTGGSASDRDVVNHVKEKCRYINAYGPTENTVLATHWEYEHGTEAPANIPIGKPISNTKIYITNGENLCGIGVPGELCIAGEGLARGYLNRPELTAEKFVKNPFGEGRMYRSGDLARWLPDGNIEYLGRIDEQVKIRGFRIELGEIESRIREIEGIRDCAVTARADSTGDKAIYAYYTSDTEVSVSEIRDRLSESLPEYMVPAYMTQIESIPVTRNGKLDKRALPEIEAKATREYAAPRNEIEEKICNIFSEILNVEQVGIKDSFFELGGHSLRATRLVNRIEAETGTRIALKEVFAHPTAEQLAVLAGAESEEYVPIPKAEEKEYYPMSSAQKRTYLIQQMQPEAVTYNMPQNMKLMGEVYPEKLKEAMQEMINRHEILRTQFLMIDGEPVQKIIDHAEADFEYVTSNEPDEKLISEYMKPFDLESGRTIRAKLVNKGEYHLLTLDMHHIVGDGMSMNTFMREVMALYNGEKLEPLTRQFKDYSEWMRSRDLRGQEEYWKSRFEDEIPVLDMPTDYPRPQEQSYAGTMTGAALDEEASQGVKKLISRSGATDYMVFLAAAMVTLSKYSRQEDIVIGSPISGRTHRDTESMLGMFVNTLAMRGKPEKKKTFIRFLKEIKSTCLKAYENQEYPFEELVEAAEVQRDMSRNPLFDVMLVMQNNESTELRLGSSKAEVLEYNGTIAKFDMTFNINEYNGRYVIGFEYCTDLFKKETAERILEHYIEILKAVTENAEKKLGDIEMVTSEEKSLILNDFNATETEYPRDKTVVELFEEQVRKTPDNTALVFEEESLTYAELNARANGLAYKLRENGVKPDDFVAIIADRSIEMICGIYGIIKAGGAYVPIDPTYPEERIRFMLEDCQPKAVLKYTAESIKLNNETAVIDLADGKVWEGASENPEHVNTANDLIYCIYTSGTTGKPKGVAIEHHGVAAMQDYLEKLYEVTENDNVLQFANYIFDASVWEMTLALYCGATLVLVSHDTITDTASFEKYVSDNNVTLTLLPPQYFRQTNVESFRVMTTGGSASDRDVVNHVKEKCRYINAYGPTENTVLATHWEYEHGTEVPANIPIGKPISNTKVYIANGENLCGIGVPGELCIAGDGLARGYLNRPELTEEKFVNNPFGKGRMYRSGDLARWLSDGNIEYLGRIDEQVKIRGFRIELGEIESRIREIEGIRDCAVTARADSTGDKAIYAYYTSDTEVSLSEIRDRLSESLPEYMVPAYMTQIESIPVTRNGKLDKRALPEIETKNTREYAAPRNEIEEAVCHAFSEILNVEQVGIKDSFFELGGDSIKAIRIISKLRNAGYTATVKDVMNGKTAEKIAFVVKNANEKQKYEQGEVTGKIESTPIIREFAEWNLAKPEHFNQAMMFSVDGIENEVIKQAIEELVKHHDVLRAVYRDNVLEILPVAESKLCDFYEFDYRNEADKPSAVAEKCTEIQGSVDLENGPLVKIAVFELGETKQMMFCIHHLAVDGVSWRILSEDFETAAGQLKEGKEVVLPEKTASFAEWSKKLKEYREQLGSKEKDYWKKANAKIAEGKIAGEYTETETGYTVVEFSKETTEKLLTKSSNAYGAKIDEVLIAGLARAVGRVTGQKSVAIKLEGHGREEIHEPISIDRTVGWFTNVYAVSVECSEDNDEAIINAKDTIRSVPNMGMGYGYVEHETMPDICFNYLGDFGNKSESLEVYSCGRDISEENSLPDKISINGQVMNGVLKFIIMSLNGQEFADKLKKEFEKSVDELAGYCAEEKHEEKTASDYGISDLSSEEFAEMQKSFTGEVEKIYDLTPLQAGMLFHNLEDRESTGYVVQSVYKTEFEVEAEKLREAIKLLSRRYEVLRTGFVYEKVSEPKQIVYAEREPELEILEASDEESKQISEADINRGFDLSRDTMLRVKSINIGKGKSKIVLTVHHIIMDGWCMGTLVGKLFEYYFRLEKGEAAEKIEKEIGEERRKAGEYSEYIEWLGKQDTEKAERYWKEELEGYESDCEIKAIRKPEPTEEQMREMFGEASIVVTKKLKEEAERTGSTINTAAEAAVGIMLQSCSGSKDVVFGKVVSGRNADIPGIEKMVGLFVNTIPVRVTAEDDITVTELLKKQQEKDIESTNYDYCSIAEIQSKTAQGSDLIKVLYVFENYMSGVSEEAADEESSIRVESAREQTNYGISISGFENEGKLGFKIMYDPNKYCDEEIHLIMERLLKICEEMADKPDAKICELETVTEAEKQLILNDFNATETEYPRDKTVVELFEEQVKKIPDNIALVFEDEKLTYAELNARANSLAYKLRENGVKPDDFVAIIADRSIEMICGIYGIIKAGGAYVPIDPTYPEERIRFMLEDCQPKAVLKYTAESIKLNNETAVIDLADGKVWEGASENPEHVNTANDLIYCIYTSGTTGKPKGVTIEHHGVAAMQDYLEKLYEVTENDNVLQFANYIFDASVWEMTLALYCGATLVLVSHDTITDTASFEKYVSDNNVTLTLLPPQYFRQTNVESFRVMTTGGSASDRDVVNHVKEKCRYINAYGPTENTVLATHWEYEHGTEAPANIPIGKPISNTKIYITNGENLCGIGVPGELCIAGDGLARGYLNRPELTAEKFVKNPFGEGRMYRSGDLARWLPDGNIEYLGRIDEQVKIRGFRIELGEIESRIREIEGIRDCAVTARADSTGDKAIYAYYTSDTEVSVSEIRDRLSESLPEYMVPAYMTQIESIPVTRNGKLDKRALPEIEAKATREYAAPRNEIEEKICNIFSEILNVEQVGIKDSFFELGGHSLRATRLVNRIEAETGTRIALKEVFSHPTAEQLAVLAGAESEEYVPIPKAEEKEYYPMSSAQKRTYLIQQMQPEAVTYNMPQNMKLMGEVYPEKLKEAMQEMINRHEILRTQFLMIDGEPVQKIIDYVEADFEYVTSKEPDEKLISEYMKPFDLESGKTIRAKLVNKGEYHLLTLDMHHIVGDGMSMNTFMREVMALYNGEKLEPLTRQFKDYSEWIRSRDLRGQEEYWKSRFEDEIPVLDMPTDYPRPQEQSYAGTMTGAALDEEASQGVKKLISRSGATDYMVFLAAAMVTLSKYSRQEDIVIGSPISGRTHRDTESMLGMFVNTLAMRGKPEKKKTFIRFLKEIKSTCLKAYENQEYPFEELVEAAEVQRDMSRNPLFDVMLVMQNNESTELRLGNSSIEGTVIESTVAKFDMTFNINEYNGRYVIGFEYCTDLFKKETAERILEHYIEILKAVTENAEKKLGDIEMVTSEEKSLILNDFNATETEYPRDKTVVELFEEQVRKTPDNTALVFEEESLTYAELNARANSLAYKLRENGVKPDDFVAIIADRSIEMICGIYGIIKAGGAYVPIDPTYPEERIRFMLEDCQPKAVLKYTAESIKLNNEIPVIDLADGKVWEGASENPEHVNTANDLIYCIYTSGTTGKPKGSIIENKSVVRLVKNTNYIELDEHNVILQTGSMSFDASTLEVWGALLNGGKLVISTQDVITDSEKLRKLMSREKVNTMWLTSTLFNQMISEENDIFDSLERLLIGGEKLSDDHVRIMKSRNNGVKLTNGYGPTENTTFTTTYEIPAGFEIIPIGKPISNTKVYIANGENLCGIGVPGELCIAGDGLARGYLNRPELTAEKFVKNPFGEGRMYRSGDLARWLPDGNIEYLGRIDEQVKIRGFRIELGEIESRIREIEGIRDCAVTARADSTGDKAIYAYYTSDTEVSVSEIRDRLSESLPEYMVPAYMTQIESIPVTRNGKLDKRALPEIETKNTREYAAPRNEIEEAVCHAFSEILNVEQVGIKDSFFELGGDSIKAIRIISKLRNAGYTATVKDVMNGKTAEKIAFVVKNANEKQKYEQGEVTGKIESTPIIREFAEWNLAKPEHFNQAMMFSVDGIENEVIKQAIEELVKHHDALRAVYRDNVLEILPVAESKLCDFYEFDYRNETDKPSAVAEKCTEIQGSVDLENGPLVKIAVFELGETKQMMFCIHHLAVDGVSWRILSEDFETAAGQLKEGKEVVLPEKTASFVKWSKKLKEYGEQLGSKEKDYWKKANAKIAEGKIAGEYTETETGYTVVEFSKETTEKLLTKSSNAYGAKIDEVLIAGLARAVGRVTGQKSVAIKLEGHGREEIREPISIDRTVGWFTNVYAVSVECSEDNDEAIINAKDTIRSVPNMGMGYGYVEHETMPDICFNYLGDFGDTKIETYSAGESVSKYNRLLDSITINGQVTNGKLSFILISVYGQAFIDELSQKFVECIEELKNYYDNYVTTDKTVADIDVEQLDTAEIDLLNSLF